MINKKDFLEAVKRGDELLQGAKLNRAKVEMSVVSLGDALEDYTKGAVSCYLHPQNGSLITDRYSGGEKFNVIFSGNDIKLTVATLVVKDADWETLDIEFRNRVMVSYRKTDDSGGFDAILLYLLKLPSTINTINYLVEHEE